MQKCAAVWVAPLVAPARRAFITASTDTVGVTFNLQQEVGRGGSAAGARRHQPRQRPAQAPPPHARRCPRAASLTYFGTTWLPCPPWGALVRSGAWGLTLPAIAALLRSLRPVIATCDGLRL